MGRLERGNGRARGRGGLPIELDQRARSKTNRKKQEDDEPEPSAEGGIPSLRKRRSQCAKLENQAFPTTRRTVRLGRERARS